MTDETPDVSDVQPDGDTVATPEPPPPKPGVHPDFPDLRNWGGLRKVKKEVRRSATIMVNREAIAYELLAMASTKITDIVSWDDAGNVRVKSSGKIDHRHARMIKSVKQTFAKDGSVQSFEVTLFDKVSLLRVLAQCAGLTQKDQDEDRPAVVGMTVRGPKSRKPKTIDNGG
jgi:hypothetical protein